LDGVKQRLALLRSRIDRLYEDKLDGKITQEFWATKASEYREQELALETALKRLTRPVVPDHALTVERIFELANKAYSLYLTRNAAEQAQLRRAQRAKNEQWSGREDLNLRPPAPKAGALPGCATPRLW
jgi:hypothetical protein